MKAFSHDRFHPGFSAVFHFNPPDIRNRQYPPFLPLKIIIILHLQADNPLIITAGKTDGFCRQIVKRIISGIILIHHHTVKLIASDQITGFLWNIGTDAFDRTDLFHPFPDLFIFHIQCFRQHPDNSFRIFELVMDH